MIFFILPLNNLLIQICFQINIHRCLPIIISFVGNFNHQDESKSNILKFSVSITTSELNEGETLDFRLIALQ